MTITLDALARESGTFLMVAMDQRESLRTMLAQHHDGVDDERMVRFKLAVAREQAPGGVVEDTDLDDGVDAAGARDAGVVALKLLVIWRDDAERPKRVETSRRFAAIAREH